MKLAQGWLRLALVMALPVMLAQCSHDQGALKSRRMKYMEPLGSAETARDWGRPQSVLSKGAEMAQDRLQEFGDLSLAFKDYSSSLVNYAEILKDQPERYEVRYRVGVILLMTGRLEAARQELARVLIQRPEMLEAHEALGLVHLQEKQLPGAIEEFQFVLSREPERARTHHLLGVAYLTADQANKAIASLEKAARLDPQHVGIYAALGQAYMKVKKYGEAVAWLQKGVSLDPQNQKLNHQIGMALAAQERYPEALEAFMRVGDEAQALNNIGVHYFMAGRYEDAARCFQRALEVRPSYYEEAKINLNRALEKLQHHANNAS